MGEFSKIFNNQLYSAVKKSREYKFYFILEAQSKGPNDLEPMACGVTYAVSSIAGTKLS